MPEVRKKSLRQIEEEEEEEKENLRRRREMLQDRHDRVHKGDTAAVSSQAVDPRKRQHRS